MITHDNFHHATDLSNQAQAFLSQKEIAPTPVNFSVLYAYFSQDNQALNSDLNSHISEGNIVDSVFLESLFGKFIAKKDAIEEKLLSPIDEALKYTLACIDSHVENEQQAIVNLKKADNALAEMTQHASLHHVVNYILKSVNRSQKQRKDLSERLSQTSSEVQSLRIQLEESRNEANRDSLTGLLNRRGCEQRLELLNLKEVHKSLAIDIDHFKKVNDNFGHFIGDKVIQQVAKVISSHVKKDDIAVRYGGEEFLVVVANKPLNVAHNIAENIRRSIENLKLVQKQTNTKLPSISVSIGLAEIENDNSWTSLFKRADQALYRAKSSGRNCCVVSELAYT